MKGFNKIALIGWFFLLVVSIASASGNNLWEHFNSVLPSLKERAIIYNQNFPEKYEEMGIKVADSFAAQFNKDDKIIILVDGSDFISSAVLALLQPLRGHNIEIVYIEPEIEYLSSLNKMHENAIYSILQEYTRSAVFKKMWLFSCNKIANVLGDISILEYNNSIGSFVAKGLSALWLYEESESIFGVKIEDSDIDVARIGTIGIVNLEGKEDVVFYPLQHERARKYYFSYPMSQLRDNKGLIRQIKSIIQKMNKDLGSNFKYSSYSIYSTNFDVPFCYFWTCSNIVQQKKEKEIA